MKQALLILFLLSLGVFSSEKAARDFYLNKNYKQANQLYQQLVETSPHNFSYLYNFASSLYRLNNPIQAKIYYLKALKIRPNDTDTKMNIALINKSIIDQQFLFNRHWIQLFGISIPMIFVMMLFGSIFILTSVIFIQRRKYDERAKRFGVVFLFIWIILFGVSISALVFYPRYGVIASEKVQVFSGPSITQTALFYAHEGAECKVLESTQFWVQVQFPNGLKGWVQKETMRVI